VYTTVSVVNNTTHRTKSIVIRQVDVTTIQKELRTQTGCNLLTTRRTANVIATIGALTVITPQEHGETQNEEGQRDQHQRDHDGANQKTLEETQKATATTAVEAEEAVIAQAGQGTFLTGRASKDVPPSKMIGIVLAPTHPTEFIVASPARHVIATSVADNGRPAFGTRLHVVGERIGGECGKRTRAGSQHVGPCTAARVPFALAFEAHLIAALFASEVRLRAFANHDRFTVGCWTPPRIRIH